MEHMWSKWATRHFRETLALLSPDVVWVIPHCWSIPPLAKILPTENIAFHVTMQDLADCRSFSRQFGSQRSHTLALMADHLYATARTRDATSHPMIAHLRQRTGHEATQMLHAGLEQSDFDYLENKKVTPTDAIRVGYAGTISVEDVFELFVRSLAAVRNKLPKPVSLELFGAHSYRDRRWFDASWMHERGNLPEPELRSALRDCTWGFSPMSFSEDDPQQRFSFPTKFVSYLAAGLPVFTLGHAECSVVQMAQEHKVGVCVTPTDEDLLRRKMQEALSIEDPWKVFREEMLRCARKEFTAADKRETLYLCFFECAEKPES
jgi:glycosyltransferase involved in cell wall biosynthesis